MKQHSKLFLLLPLMISLMANETLAFDELYDESEITFVTPAKMTSSYRDTPNSVTSLDVEDLKFLGIDTFVDAMRLVPGMIVAETHGSNATIGYHGTSVHVPRRMQILYNSNRLYRSGYADINWQRMPIELTDLERIEVVRGSNITDYGTNAFTSTVNMIQKPVALETNASALVKTTTTGEKRGAIEVNGQLGQSKGVLRFSAIESDGFDKSPQIKSMDDDYKGNSFLYNGEIEFSGDMLLDWHIAGSEYEYEFPAYDNITSDSSDVQASVGSFYADGPTKEETLIGTLKLTGSNNSGSTTSKWNIGTDVTQFDRKQDLVFCFPAVFYDENLEALDKADNIHIVFDDLNLLLGSSLMTGVGALDKSILAPLSADQKKLLSNMGQTIRRAGLAAVMKPLCANTDQDLIENRYSLFAGYQRSSEKFTFSSDVSVREDRASSETYLAGTHSRNSYEWSNNVRYRMTDKLVANLGVMAESNSDINEVYYSPRASFNIAFDSNNILRLLVADSKRLSGIHETERQWQYPFKYINGATDYYGRTESRSFRVATNGELEPEQLKLYEIGYTFLTSSNGTVIDVKYFNEKYKRLISEPFSYLAFSLTNNGQTDVEGVEIGLSHKIGNTKIGGGVSYLENDTDTLEEKSLYSRVSGNIWSIIPLNESINLGIVYFGSKNQANNNYDRLDLNLNYTRPLGATELSIDLNYKRMPSDQGNFTEYSSTDPFIFAYNERNIYSLKAKVTF